MPTNRKPCMQATALASAPRKKAECDSTWLPPPEDLNATLSHVLVWMLKVVWNKILKCRL